MSSAPSSQLSSEVLAQSPSVADVAKAEVPQPLSPPSQIAALMVMAVEKNLGVEGIREVAALVREEKAAVAEAEFDARFIAFRCNVPKIVKNKSVYNKTKVLIYRYADLPQIMAAIDPLLHANGFTYTWDVESLPAKEGPDRLVVTCTLHHVSGHKRTSKFISKPTGGDMLSANQISGSGITFGKRYSLCGVLGITTDDDTDDAVEQEKPQADAAAPKVDTRSEREAKQQGTPQPDKKPGPFDAVGARWRAMCKKNGTPVSVETWRAWARKTCNLADDAALDPSDANLDLIDSELQKAGY